MPGGELSTRTGTWPSPSLIGSFIEPPFRKTLSPQPAPPPTLLAGVGSALAPPETEVVGWLSRDGDSGMLIYGPDTGKL